MACNGVLTPLPPLKKIGNPPTQSSNFLLPYSDWKWLLLHFSQMATSNKHMFIFLIKCCHNWFLKKLQQYLKETRSYHYAFLFFVCDDLSFINTMQKTFKPSKKKMFKCLGWMRKIFTTGNISWRTAAENVSSKKVYLKNNSVPNTCLTLPLKKIFCQSLTDAFYIKLVIPKILFILALLSFNFYFEIMWPSPLSPPPKLKFLIPPQQRLFWNF